MQTLLGSLCNINLIMVEWLTKLCFDQFAYPSLYIAVQTLRNCLFNGNEKFKVNKWTESICL